MKKNDCSTTTPSNSRKKKPKMQEKATSIERKIDIRLFLIVEQLKNLQSKTDDKAVEVISFEITCTVAAA